MKNSSMASMAANEFTLMLWNFIILKVASAKKIVTCEIVVFSYFMENACSVLEIIKFFYILYNFSVITQGRVHF